MAPVIQFRNVFKAFGNHVIYEGMNLEIERGETLSVIGGSGQGKSVCMRPMIGLLYADEEVLFAGSDVGETGDQACASCGGRSRTSSERRAL
ncbi:MAG: ATP-binding cassette domain-containing protein [Nannocystaceae bacterium]